MHGATDESDWEKQITIIVQTPRINENSHVMACDCCIIYSRHCTIAWISNAVRQHFNLNVSIFGGADETQGITWILHAFLKTFTAPISSNCSVNMISLSVTRCWSPNRLLFSSLVIISFFLMVRRQWAWNLSHLCRLQYFWKCENHRVCLCAQKLPTGSPHSIKIFGGCSFNR